MIVLRALRYETNLLNFHSFADDMTCFIKDSSSYTNLFVTLKTFGEFTSLKINNEETEALALRNSRSLWEGHSDLLHY